MQWLAQQIMHGRLRAALIIVTTVMLSLLFPPVGIISAAAFALVTLRNGWKEALLVSILCGGVFWLMLQLVAAGNAILIVLSSVASWLPVILLAAVLRWSRHLPWVVEGALLVALAVLLVQYLFLDDPAGYWYELMLPLFESLAEGGAFEASGATSEAVATNMAAMFPMLLTIVVFVQLVLAVFIGRWWQALLYNPGGFREEFHALRLGKLLALSVIPLFAATLFAGTGGLLGGIAITVIVAFAIQGLAVTHAILWRRNASGWLIGVYVLLLLAAPYVLAVLGILGITDVWLDFRRRDLENS